MGDLHDWLNDDDSRIPEHPKGGGSFGRWITDDSGLPAYEYELDERSDALAEYNTTRGVSRDHWHLLGNDREKSGTATILLYLSFPLPVLDIRGHHTVFPLLWWYFRACSILPGTSVSCQCEGAVFQVEECLHPARRAPSCAT
ncbi:MAG TPA: hypothetical protein PL033_14070 [Candidatus Brocadiia bacterium]|nr:hypothetical protein [Candidatus Brocadiia bacterium]